MAHPLDGVRQKIARAKTHSADLKERLSQVLGPDIQSFTLERDPQTPYHVLRVHGVPSIDPEWSIIVGDCLFNLRSALDHLAWQLVILDNKTPLAKETQFPIRESPFNKKGQRIATQLKPPVHNPDILDGLERVQPYMSVDLSGVLQDPKTSPLWMLSTLNNIDKHRILLVIACVPDIGNMWWGWSATEEQPRGPDIRANLAELKDDSPVAWFDFHGAEPPEDFDPHPSVQVVLNEPDTARLGVISLQNAIDNFIWWVEWHIVGMTFWPLFP